MQRVLIRLGRLVPAVAVVIAIATFSHRPHGGLPMGLKQGTGDKLVHAAAYAVLSWSLMLALGGIARRPSLWVWVLVVVMLLGAADEWTQQYVGRSCSVSDWLANIGGACMAVVLAEGICQIAMAARAVFGRRKRLPGLPAGDGGPRKTS